MSLVTKWVTCKQDSNYMVSSKGEVIACERVVVPTRGRATYLKKGAFLKPVKLKNGYCKVSFSINSKVTQYYVHDLVATNFIGDKPDGHCINHVNGEKTDNRLINLEIVTVSQNNQHAYDMGLKKRQFVGNQWVSKKFKPTDRPRRKSKYTK
jgi:hypothetical protein